MNTWWITSDNSTLTRNLGKSQLGVFDSCSKPLFHVSIFSSIFKLIGLVVVCLGETAAVAVKGLCTRPAQNQTADKPSQRTAGGDQPQLKERDWDSPGDTGITSWTSCWSLSVTVYFIVREWPKCCYKGSSSSNRNKLKLTAALASACLAFFTRALQMSKSRRRFSRSRRSFCTGCEGSNQKRGERAHPARLGFLSTNELKSDHMQKSLYEWMCCRTKGWGCGVDQSDSLISSSSLLPGSCVEEWGSWRLRFAGTRAQLLPV